MSRDVRLVIILKFLRDLSFGGAVFSLFFFDKGFGVSDLAIYFAVDKLSQALFEIPTGVFADKFGRKLSLRLSRVATFIGVLFLLFGGNMFFMVIAAVLDGLCNALYSDSDTSLVYDKMKHAGKQSEYPKFMAHYDASGYLAYTIGAMVGAAIAASGAVEMNYIIRIPVLVIAFWLTGKLVEKVSDIKASKTSLAELRGSFRKIRRDRDIIRIVGFMALAFTLNMLIYDYYQAYALRIGLPVVIFGLLALTFATAQVAPQFLSYKFVKRQHFSKLFTALIILASVLIISAALCQNLLGFILLLLAIMVTGFSVPISSAIIQTHSDTEHRTTITSFGTLVSILLYGLMSILFCFISENFGLFGGIGAVGAGVLGVMLISRRA